MVLVNFGFNGSQLIPRLTHVRQQSKAICDAATTLPILSPMWSGGYTTLLRTLFHGPSIFIMLPKLGYLATPPISCDGYIDDVAMPTALWLHGYTPICRIGYIDGYIDVATWLQHDGYMSTPHYVAMATLMATLM